MLFFFWQGLGFLAVVIPFVIYFLCEFLVDAIFGKGYMDAHHWTWGVSLLVSAALVWLLGHKLRDPGRELVDPKTGEKFFFRKKHTFFFIPMEIFAALLALAGVIRLFV